jgi:hypothetical protein
MYNGEYRHRHLQQAGLMMFPDGQVRPDPKHEYYKYYKQAGYVSGPLEPHEIDPEVTKTWRPAAAQGVSFVRIHDVQPGDVEDPKEVHKYINHFRSGDHSQIPPLHLYQFNQEGPEYATPEHSSQLAAAKKAGMTHLPATIEHLWK